MRDSLAKRLARTYTDTALRIFHLREKMRELPPWLERDMANMTRETFTLHSWEQMIVVEKEMRDIRVTLNSLYALDPDAEKIILQRVTRFEKLANKDR